MKSKLERAKRLYFTFLFTLSFFASMPAEAAAERLTLRQAIDRAIDRNGDLRSQRLQIDQAAEEIGRARGEFGPHIEALLGIGPITKAEGNSTFVKEDTGIWGRTVFGKITVMQPLYTWGRKTNYENAARAGMHVKKAESELRENQLRYEVKEAFYGYQLANSLREFISGGKAELEKAIEKRKEKKNNSVKEGLRLEIFLHEVESREAEVTKYLELAREGLSLRVGANRGQILPKEEWLLPEPREKKLPEFYVDQAHQARPEFRQLAEGVFAKRSLAKAEEKALIPILGFIASYEASETNVRTAQPGVFSYDPYNHKTTSAGIGLKWDFQWELQQSKAAKFRAEAEELELKEDYARQGVETEVRKAYLELVEAEARLKASTESYKAGKKWLTGEAIGFASGLGSTQGVVEAYGARAETTKSYFEALFRHQMAWATLSKAVGIEVDPLLAER